MDRERERAQTRISADVAGRPLAANVLLAGRQGQHPAAPTVGVDGLADETSWHLADELVAAGEETEIGAAEIERVAKRLAFSRDDVRPHLARWSNGTQREDLGYDDDKQRAGLVADLRELRVVADFAKEIGVLHDDAGRVATDQPGEVLTAAGSRGLRGHLEADKAGIGLAHPAVMRMETARQYRLPAPRQAVGHHHRLGAGSGTVIVRGVRDLHTGQERDLGLKFEEILQRSL